MNSIKVTKTVPVKFIDTWHKKDHLSSGDGSEKAI